jgi:hypothetical protein
MFVSPSYSNFEWSKDGLETAKCSKCKEDTPGEDCSCGLYSTFEFDTAGGYRDHSPISPILLFEVHGDHVLSGSGIRSLQLMPRWVILDSFEPLLYGACLQAADYFSIPTIPKSRAIAMMEIWNIALFVAKQDEWDIPNWREWYEPTATQLADYTDDYLLALANKWLGGEHVKSTTKACQPV